MTSMRRRYVASTSLRRHVPAGNLAPQYSKPSYTYALSRADVPNTVHNKGTFRKTELSVHDNNADFDKSLQSRKNHHRCTFVYTVQILRIGTDRSKQTVQTKIRLLLKKQSDQGLHCLPFHQHLLDALMQCYTKLFYF